MSNGDHPGGRSFDPYGGRYDRCMRCGSERISCACDEPEAALAPVADPPSPHYGAFPGERCACPACLDSASEYAHAPQPAAWPLVDQAHSPLWTGADEAEAGLLGEPEAGAAAGQGQATGPARTHEWRFEGGSAVVTVETGGHFDWPDGKITTDPGCDPFQSGPWAVLGAEILRLAGRAQAAEAFAAEALEDRDRIHRALRDASVALTIAEGRADVAEERASDRDAAVMTAEEGLEINAELAAALAVLLAEPPPEPCSPSCRTPHLSAKASEAVDAAVGCWRALEAAHAGLLAELGEANRKRRLWGERLVDVMDERDAAHRVFVEAGVALKEAWAERDTARRERDEALASAAHNAEGWEEEASATLLARGEGRREGLGLAGEIVQRLAVSAEGACRDWRTEILECSNQIRRMIATDNLTGRPGGQ